MDNYVSPMKSHGIFYFQSCSVFEPVSYHMQPIFRQSSEDPKTRAKGILTMPEWAIELVNFTI